MRRTPGMGGESVLRAVISASAAAAGAGAARPTSARVSRALQVPQPSSSSSTSSPASPTSPPTFSAASYEGEGDEWEHVDGGEAEEDAAGELGFLGFPERLVFGRVPTTEEVDEAVSALQQTFVPAMFSQVAEDGYASNLEQNAADKEVIPAAKSGGSSDEFSAESHSDWIEPTMNLYTSRTSLSREHEKVYDAFRLLQINPSVQKMVVSLSSDKAVWDAVMKNDVVQEFKKSFCEDGDYDTRSSDENPARSDGTDGILGMIFGHTKAKILELIDKIGMLFNMLFHSQEKPQNSTFIDDALRSSFMLTVIVFLIVVATRVEKA
ncbi:uncharacterized protein LOC109714906 isoform X2 [Ananas comosus]|uniref:Uncharacterized protein LOC109714906 isoform X2 n=1 Tax=Ananas comosus TaxID=4615 RepID=A0A6P5FP41_ANACO|nr:uncharacterized protein LOC109714906 isoform X2 [Ananas comosus]